MTLSSRAGICFGKSWFSFEYWLRECSVLRLFSFWLVSKFGVSLLSGLYLLGIVALGWFSDGGVASNSSFSRGSLPAARAVERCSSKYFVSLFLGGKTWERCLTASLRRESQTLMAGAMADSLVGYLYYSPRPSLETRIVPGVTESIF